MDTVTNWISAGSSFGTTIIAVVAAWVGLATFKSQRTTSDITLALDIFKEINRYWDRLSAEKDSGSYQYNMGQILVQFEIAAGLFNEKTLSGKANIILGDHIVEVFTLLSSSADGKMLLSQCASSPTTYVELRKFMSERMPQALVSLDFKDALASE